MGFPVKSKNLDSTRNRNLSPEFGLGLNPYQTLKLTLTALLRFCLLQPRTLTSQPNLGSKQNIRSNQRIKRKKKDVIMYLTFLEYGLGLDKYTEI